LRHIRRPDQPAERIVFGRDVCHGQDANSKLIAWKPKNLVDLANTYPDADVMTAVKQRRDLTKPEPGFYILRLVRRGWQVPARIIEQDGSFTAEVNGEPLKVVWTRDELEASAVSDLVEGRLFAHPLLRIVLFGEATDEPTYRYRLAMKDWAETHDKDHPAANPTKPMDPRLMPAEDF
jgi:hypothetical protein